MEELNILIDREIDPDSLDTEWLLQPSLYYKYSDALNYQMEVKDDLKLDIEKQEKEVERVKAQLELDIRNDPKAHDLEKATDASVKAAVLCDDKYRKELEKLFSKKEELNVVQNKVNKLFTAVNTIAEKKVSLSNLGGLLNQQYFAAPSIPRNLQKEYSKRVESTKAIAKEKVKKRMRRHTE